MPQSNTRPELPSVSNERAKMATGKQIEELKQQIGGGTPARSRNNIVSGLNSLKNGVGDQKTIKDLLDTVVADAAAAGQSDYGLSQIQSQWSANLVDRIANGFSYAGLSGIQALAQVLADLSEQAGLEGGPNELRLTAGGNVVPVSQDA